MFKIALICGGPSLERGISLNSARSVLDHLGSEKIEIIPVYFDSFKNAYRVSQAQLYSNTPSDFDFKLKKTSQPLSKSALVRLLSEADIAFPVMHGPFGEDGQVQDFLEENKIPYVGTDSNTCKQIFDKYRANAFIKNLGFYTLPCALLKIYHSDHKEIIDKFFKDHKIKRAIVKPASGGSSIGVFSVSTPKEALEKASLIFSKRMDTRVVLEPFAPGIEFTVIVLQNRFGLPVAILPTEIETDYTEHQIFDFRKKYLPTRQVTYHCPPRFSNQDIERIQVQAEQLFAATGMRDFARFDGWLMPDGRIWFADLNPISGMEQNSFLFQQSSRVGLSHSEVLRYILSHACQRYGFQYPAEEETPNGGKTPVNVLFGGKTSERQVSLMSGTNVWLKLRRSKKFSPRPFLLDLDNNVWALPYQLTLNHTVEEVAENCRNYGQNEARLRFLEQKARLRLGLPEKANPEFGEPDKLSLSQFIRKSSFIFDALHGGEGEDGTFQSMFEKAGVPYTGPDAQTSRLCIDKWATANLIRSFKIPGVGATDGELVKTADLFKMAEPKLKVFWQKLKRKLNTKSVIVKPRGDGCSSGVVHLFSFADLKTYLKYLESKALFVPKGTFYNQLENIEMPLGKVEDLLFERFIETDIIHVRENELRYQKKTGLIEITVGIIGLDGKTKALNPSLTVSEGEVLSVEEKFQGGTGVNITPPPSGLVGLASLQKSKKLAEQIAERIGVKGYCRIDAFMEVETGDLTVIEINTLPGLTPSTVLFHQGLAETPPIFPRELLETLIENKL